MPSRVRGRYRAERKRNTITYYLGYYDTYEEAKAKELAFDLMYPKESR